MDFMIFRVRSFRGSRLNFLNLKERHGRKSSLRKSIGNHALPVSRLKCPEARKWMKENMPDQDQLWTLRLSGRERIWRVFGDGVYFSDGPLCDRLSLLWQMLL